MMKRFRGAGLTLPLDWTMVAIGSRKGARRSEEMYKRTQASFRLVNKDRDRGLYALGMSKLK
jgi:hypothetical protein